MIKIKQSRSALRAQLDKLWGTFILLRHRQDHGELCRICNNRIATCAYHIVPKQRGMSIRWDLDNGCGACSSCNYAEMMNRSLYQDVKHPEIFGQEFVRDLKLKAAEKAMFSSADLVDIRDVLKEKIEKFYRS